MSGDGRRALAASAPGRECGLAGVNAVSFGPNDTPIAAGMTGVRLTVWRLAAAAWPQVQAVTVPIPYRSSG